MNTPVFPLPELSLGVAAFDATHARLLAALEALSVASDDAAFQACFAEALASLEDDFREEELRMEDLDYPGLRAHRAQHCRVLGAMHEASLAVKEGDIDAGRRAVRLLPQWMRFHIWTMDAALAAAMLQASDAQCGCTSAAGVQKQALQARLEIMRAQLVERIHEQLCRAEERAALFDEDPDLALLSDLSDEIATSMLDRDLESLAEIEATLRMTRA